jgi:hypothetical protein
MFYKLTYNALDELISMDLSFSDEGKYQGQYLSKDQVFINAFNENCLLVFMNPLYFLVPEKRFIKMKQNFVALQKIKNKTQYDKNVIMLLQFIVKDEI